MPTLSLRSGLTSAVVAVVISASAVAGQLSPHSETDSVPVPPTGLRTSLGVGGGSFGPTSGPSGRITVSGALGDGHVLSARASVVEEFTIFTSPAESVWDVGIMYGHERRGRRGYGSISAGLAVVGGVKRGPPLRNNAKCDVLPFCIVAALHSDHRREPFQTVGIPLEAEAVVALGSKIGLGANVFSNLNTERSVVGATVALVFGQLR